MTESGNDISQAGPPIRHSRARRLAAGVAAAIALLCVLFAAFPWGLLATNAEAPLSRLLGRTVRIESARRTDWFSLRPTVELRDVTISQPPGFGATPMARIGRATVQFRALPALLGRFRPLSIDLAGGEVLMLRNARGGSNWQGDDDTAEEGDGNAAPIELLTVRDTRVRLIDDKRHVRLNAAIAVNRDTGLTINGAGTHRGSPLRLSVHASDPAVAGLVRIAVRSGLARVEGTVTPVRPLDFSRFDARVTAGGADLTYLDDILQAGLFPSRPFSLTAHIRREPPGWRIARLDGRFGQTRLTTAFTVTKRDGRTILNGDVDAATLNFDDFSSASQRARAATQQARIGPRVIPSTRIEFDKLGKLDGTVRLRARRLLSTGPSAFRSLTATATMDRQRLTISPLTAGLRSGTLSGRVVVNDRAGTPELALDLRIQGARIERLLLPGDAIEGPVQAHIRLNGHGSDVRAALAHSSGKVGVVMPTGTVRRDYAVYAGGDLLKTIGTLIGGGNKDKRVGLRCLVADFVVTGGTMTPKPLVVDADITRADGTGHILLANETIALSLTGRAKHPGPIQSTAPVRLIGTLSDPKLDIRPPRAERKGKGGVLDRIGFLLKGLKTGDKAEATQAPARADCAALRRAALR